MTETVTSIAASTDAVSAAAARLRRAHDTGVPVPPVRDLIGRDDVQSAYSVQARLTAGRVASGARIVGRKIGLTSEAVQAQLGVDQPDFGVLFSDMAHDDDAVVPPGLILQPRVEAEIAFVLKDDLDDRDGALDHHRVRSAIEYAVAAIEICGSRVENWEISIADTVADNASAGAYVLGSQRRTLEEFDPRDAVMEMTIDDEVVSHGTGTACLGDPINAVVWLARRCAELGEPLRAGQLILSGALGPMRPITPGNQVRAVVDPLGAVAFTLGKEDQE